MQKTFGIKTFSALPLKYTTKHTKEPIESDLSKYVYLKSLKYTSKQPIQSDLSKYVCLKSLKYTTKQPIQSDKVCILN